MSKTSFSRSIVWSLGLASASLSFGQKTETTQEIETFFGQRAETLQKHLSVPLSDQAFHKRFMEAYTPLEAGRIPNQWRDALVQRLLALAGANGGSLSAEQQTQISSALNVLGSAGVSASASAAALSSLGNALGISASDAANALSSAASDSSLFNGNSAISRSFMQNTQNGFDTIVAQSNNPNSLNMAKINPPEQMRYENEGPITGVLAAKSPNPGALTMGNYASKLGQSSGSYANKGTSGPNGDDKTKPETPPKPVHNDIIGQALSQAIPKLGTGSSSSASSSSFTPTNNSSPHNAPNAMLNKVSSGTSANTPVVPATATAEDPFKFDPQVLLGGDYLEQYQKRVSSLTQAPNTSSPGTASGLTGQQSAGSSLATSARKKEISDMGDQCEENLHKMYGFTQGKVPTQMSFAQVTEMWKTFGKQKNQVRADLMHLQTEESKRTGIKNNPLVQISFENLSLPEWNPLITVETPLAEDQKTFLKKEAAQKSEGSKRVQVYKSIVDDLRTHFSAHLNGLANTDQDACIFSASRMGSSNKGECSKEFAVPSDKNSSFRNSPLTQHLKIIALLDSIREINSPQAKSVLGILREGFREERKKVFQDNLDGSSPTQTVLMSDDAASSSAEATQKTSGTTPSRPRRSFRLQSYLFDCMDPNTSWVAKIQDLEILARKSLIRSCPAQSGEQEDGGFRDTSVPLFPSTSDICNSQPAAIKTLFKAPDPKDYPDFFSMQNQISEQQCRALASTHASLLELTKTAQKKCIEKHGKANETGTASEHTKDKK